MYSITLDYIKFYLSIAFGHLAFFSTVEGQVTESYT